MRTLLRFPRWVGGWCRQKWLILTFGYCAGVLTGFSILWTTGH